MLQFVKTKSEVENMDYVIILIVIFAIIGLAMYYSISKKKEQKITEEEEIISPTENIMPLQDKTYKLQNRYNNMAQNQRTDAIINELSKIHFWVAIIGIYILSKIAIFIIIIATKGIIISELMQIILKDFSNNF